MMGAACRRLVATSLTVLVASACSGEGSDIGPRLPRLPEVSSKVLVLDDQNRGVVSGRVAIAGSSIAALTGRNGRADFLVEPRGVQVFEAAGSAGAATAGDRLADINVELTMVGIDVPTPIHLPDLPDAASSLIASGVQGATTQVTSTTGDSIVTLTTGSSVTHDGSPASVSLRVGELAPEHLPGELPLGGSGTLLFGHGVYVDPPSATFSPGLDIDCVDDLGIGSGTAQLFRLNPDTGRWLAVSTGTASGGRITRAGALTTGGLYAFGIVVDYVAVTGTVLSADVDADGNPAPVPVPSAMVRVDQRYSTTGADGTFLVDFVPATLGDGATPRNAVVEVFAGGSWLPAIATTTVAVANPPPATVDAGTITLDTTPSSNLRIQQVVRARADPFQPARFSSLQGGVALATASDRNGQLMFEDVPTAFFGLLEGRPLTGSELYYGQVIGFMEAGRRWSQANQFLANRPWFIGTRSARAFACDAIGGGPILGAAIIRGTGLDGLVVITNENGFGFTDRDYLGRATASVRTERDGFSITHARSVVLPNADQIELPLRRVNREPLGMFDRHGLVAGELTGANIGGDQSLTVTRRFTRQEWWDEVIENVPLVSSLPIDVDPATPGNVSFQAGIDAAGGHLAAIETAPVGGKPALQRMGLLADFTPTEGAVIERDVPLDLVADTQFVLVDAAASANALVDLSGLELALGFQLANGQVVDVARDLAGSVTTTASDVRVQLPALAGGLAGGQWLALVHDTRVVGISTLTHASLVPLAGATTTGFVFPEIPTMTPPASPSANGFDFTFVLPPGALCGIVELRSSTANDLLLWQSFVPAEATSFTFPQLPVDAETPLIAGRTYSLSVTALFGPEGSPPVRGYLELSSFAQSIGIIESGVTRISRRSVQINT